MPSPSQLRFLAATADERTLLPDLDTILALAHDTPVAPRNRLRCVRLVEIDGGRYYLKTFDATPAKNRLRNATTVPRCRSDAEREALVATALREHGFEAARPVAVATRGHESFYLCAEIAGRSLADHLADGTASAELLDAAARFCGRAFATGFSLPDLAPDHVFVVDARAHHFALIDLHNGARRRRPDARAARRALRRTTRALRGAAVSRPRALRLALLFLRTAGLGRRARAILGRVPPLDTHGRYDTIGRSDAYRTRSPGRTAAELRLLAAVWPAASSSQVLDSPCGTGRLRDHLVGVHAVRWHGADRSPAMLRAARATLTDTTDTLVQADAANLPFADRSFDGVVAFRFLHHLPPQQARQVVREAARVADRFVVVSFFHPLSVHHAVRRVSELVTGRARTRHALSRARLVRWMADAGFRLNRCVAQPPLGRDLRVASFERGAANRPSA